MKRTVRAADRPASADSLCLRSGCGGEAHFHRRLSYYAIGGDGTLWAWGDSFHGGTTADYDPESSQEEAPGPAVPRREPHGWAVLVSLLPMAAAVVWRLRKKD